MWWQILVVYFVGTLIASFVCGYHDVGDGDEILFTLCWPMVLPIYIWWIAHNSGTYMRRIFRA